MAFFSISVTYILSQNQILQVLETMKFLKSFCTTNSSTILGLTIFSICKFFSPDANILKCTISALFFSAVSYNILNAFLLEKQSS